MSELEHAVIGSILRGGSMDEAVNLICADDFSFMKYRKLWDACKSLYDEGSDIDVITVGTHINDLQTPGQIHSEVPTHHNLGFYVKKLKARSIDRQLGQVGYEITQLSESDRKNKLDHAHDLLVKLSEQNISGGATLIVDALGDMVDRLDERFNSGGGLVGLSTGHNALDGILCGLRGDQLIILAARPKMGKTAAALNIAAHNALEGKKVLMFSLEMGEGEIVDRLTCALARVDNDRFRSGKLDEDEFVRIGAAVSKLKDATLYIDETPALHIGEIRARARLHARKHGVDLIIIDYLQLAKGTSENRVHEVTEISQGLKQIAKELHVPVIALSQLNRALEQRNNKRPVLSDLRDSGSIEQDADAVVFIYRDDVYNENSPHKGTAELIVAAQRNGSTGMAPSTFIGRYFRFEDFSGAWIDEEPKPKQRGFAGPDRKSKAAGY